jgi:hypothetical protein
MTTILKYKYSLELLCEILKKPCSLMEAINEFYLYGYSKGMEILTGEVVICGACNHKNIKNSQDTEDKNWLKLTPNKYLNLRCSKCRKRLFNKKLLKKYEPKTETFIGISDKKKNSIYSKLIRNEVKELLELKLIYKKESKYFIDYTGFFYFLLHCIDTGYSLSDESIIRFSHELTNFGEFVFPKDYTITFLDSISEGVEEFNCDMNAGYFSQILRSLGSIPFIEFKKQKRDADALLMLQQLCYSHVHALSDVHKYLQKDVVPFKVTYRGTKYHIKDIEDLTSVISYGRLDNRIKGV